MTPRKPNGTTPEFRAFIEDELDQRGWTKARFARELGVHKGAVHKWMLADGDENARRPSYESCQMIASLFGMDVNDILRMLKIPGAPERETQLQRDVKAMVGLLPDWMLLALRPQLNGMIRGRVQRDLANKLRSEISDADAVLVRGIDINDPDDDTDDR